MRLFAAAATAAFLAASPCMAQIVIGNGDHDSDRHAYRAEQHQRAAQHDEYRARQDAAMGDRRDAYREHEQAERHAAAAQHQERRAEQERYGGERLNIR